jgi:ABC-type uncharacterized transport system permease subunit
VIHNVFPSSSQWVLNNIPQVPNMFLNMFSITPHFYLICFAQHCPHGSWTLSRWLNIGTCMCGVSISISGSL